MKRMGIVVSVFVSAIALIGCGGSSTPTAPTTPGITSGTWSVSAQSLKFPGLQFSGTAVFNVVGSGDGELISGSFATANSPCFSVANLSGDMNGAQSVALSLGVTGTPPITMTIQLLGTTSANFTQITGTYTSIENDTTCLNGDTGNWQAVKNP